MRVRSTAVQHVKERFDESGIDIPYPIRTLDGSVDIQGHRVASETTGEN